MLVLRRMLDEPGADGIFEHVPDHPARAFRIPEDVVVETRLPQALGLLPFPGERGPLLEDPCELQEIGASVLPLEYEMEMVWHQTVRNYRRAVTLRSAPKIQQDNADGGGIAKQRPLPIAADSEEIPLNPLVQGIGQTRRMSRCHAPGEANRMPEQDLKV